MDLEIDGELVIKRTQTNSGRKKFFINDQIVTINIIKQLFLDLLELHGQHNHSLLIIEQGVIWLFLTHKTPYS